MAENRLIKAWGQGCARSMVIRIIVTIIVLCAFLSITVATILLPINQDIKIFIWVGLVVAFILVIVISVIGWGFINIRKRAVELDTIFVPLGLKGKIYLLNGRQYHGVYQGYPMHVYFSRGPLIEIFLEHKLNTRVGIGRKGRITKAVANLLSREPLDINNPSFENLVIYPLDEKWTRNLLADQITQDAVLNLMDESSNIELRSISITPGGIKFEVRYIPYNDINSDEVRTWINDLYTLIRRSAALPQPDVFTEETKIETINRTDRSKFIMPIIGITCGLLIFSSFCILVIVSLIIFLEESGL